MLLGSTAQYMITRTDHDEITNAVGRQTEQLTGLVPGQDLFNSSHPIQSFTSTGMIRLTVQIDGGESTQRTVMDHVRVRNRQNHSKIT